MKEDGPSLGDVGVSGRFKPSDNFRLGLGPVARLARELFSSNTRDARHDGAWAAGCEQLFTTSLQRVWSVSESAGFRDSSQLRHRPSSLGLDHGWCVYSKTRRTLAAVSLLLRESRNGILSVRTQKNMQTVFTSLLRSSIDMYNNDVGVTVGQESVQNL